MIFHFREQNGDYLAIDTDTNRYYRESLDVDHFEGRATAIAGLIAPSALRRSAGAFSMLAA